MSLELLQKLKKQSKLDRVNILSKSDYFEDTQPIKTQVPILNVALGGNLNGGIEPGITLWAGESKHFKTSYVLLCLKSFLESDSEAIGIWFDSEFGSQPAYFKSFGIDTDRILHVPIMNIEELKFEIMNQLDNIKRGDKVMMCVDSLGNLASKKEVEDAINEKSVADMTRAKSGKSLFRMITPLLRSKDIPFMAIQHIYQTQEMYAKNIVSGGKGQYYSADNIFIIGRQQEKDSEGIAGYNFVINVEKSRKVKEKKKFMINVLYDKGINKWSGLLDLALEGKFVVKPKMGWYAKVNSETGEVESKNYREAQTNTKEFWEPILNNPKFNEWIKDNYMIASKDMIATDDSIEEAIEELEVDDE